VPPSSLASPEDALRDAIRAASMKALDIDPASIPLTYPPSAALGDLASTVCFELARVARKSPRVLAEAIVAAFEPGEVIQKLEVAGGGYINAYLDRNSFLARWLVADRTPRAATGPKVIVEHTNVNPNKAAHIGHLRNAVLGDTLVKFLTELGHPVEVQNYIDDTGVQVADLVVGFMLIRNENLEQVLERYSPENLTGQRFDYICWDLYAEVTTWYEADKDRLSHRADTLHAMEEGDNPIAALAAHVSGRIVQHHLGTMERLGIRYDVLPHESDILGMNFWEDAFRLLKSSGAIHKTTSGKNNGCWVMDLHGAEEGAGEDQKVIVRSSGTVTYVGKDIAYQMWKFGLLQRNFHYKHFDWSPAEEIYPVWTSSSVESAAQHPSFGAGHTVYNVIDTRQSYLQRVVSQGLESLGHKEEASRSIHFAYEMVALTPAAVQVLLPDRKLSSEESGKSYLEMSGRKGLGVKADDLLNTLLERATNEVRKRNPDLEEIQIQGTASRIAVGALRYYMLRFSKNRVVAFDLDTALAFEGETGPYLMYSIVRAKKILEKVATRFGVDAVDASSLAKRSDLSVLEEDVLADHWNLALLLARVPVILQQATDSLELSMIAKHAYVLAQTFNTFYHRYRVVQEEDERIRTVRTAIVRLYHDGMIHLLGLMGVEAPERM
jgi:arginyl-tRNA synthetase